MMNCSSNPFKLNVECLRGSPHRSEIAPSPRLSWAASSAGTNRITARATAFTTLAPIYSGPAPAQPRFLRFAANNWSRSGVENISWKRELDLSTTLSWWAPSPVACRSKSAAAPGRRRDVARGRPKTDPPAVLSAARRGGGLQEPSLCTNTPTPLVSYFFGNFSSRPHGAVRQDEHGGRSRRAERVRNAHLLRLPGHPLAEDTYPPGVGRLAELSGM